MNKNCSKVLIMDQAYDIDGVKLFGESSGGYTFQLELGLAAESYILASVFEHPDLGWFLMRTRNVLFDIDYEDDVVETNVSFSRTTFQIVADRELFLEFTEPPLGQKRLKKLSVNMSSDPYSLALEIELDGGLVLTLDGRSARILKENSGSVLSTEARFEAEVYVSAHGTGLEIFTQDEPLLNDGSHESEARLGIGDRAEKIKGMRKLGASKQWEALPQLLFELRRRPLDKNYCREASTAIAELTKALGADHVSLSNWELMAWYPHRAIHINQSFDNCWSELLPAFRAILTFRGFDWTVYSVIGDWLADKDDQRATNVIAAGFEANGGVREIVYRLSRSLGKTGDPRVLPYLLDQIDSSRHPSIVDWDLKLIGIVLAKSAHRCEVDILKRITVLCAFEQELVDVTPEAETQTGENRTYSGNIVEVDTSELRELAVAELERRSVR